MTKQEREINIGLLGAGIVGTGVINALMAETSLVPSQLGATIRIRHALVRNIERPRETNLPKDIYTTNPKEVLSDPKVDIIVEVLGGESPAIEYLRTAISNGKHVVTANKEVMAKFGPELLKLGAEKGVQVLFEASVGGGIPIIGPLQKNLLANDISSIHAIINGTTNYILTKMAQNGASFNHVLAEAKALGYAEPNPSNDVDGIDSAFKIAILATLGFHTRVQASDVYREGVSKITARDFRYAEELGYTIKLLAIAQRDGTGVQVRVHPTLIPREILLAKVDGVFNTVEIQGDLSGRILFYGRGAGPAPTASALIGDIIAIAQEISSGIHPSLPIVIDQGLPISPINHLITKYYTRMTVADRAGVLAKIAHVLANHEISLASVLQKEADPQRETAEIVLMTHPAREESMQRALIEMKTLDIVRELGNVIRVEDLVD